MQRREFLKVAVVGAGTTLVIGVPSAWALTAPVLSGVILSNTSVRLDWTDAGDEQLYRVFRNGLQRQDLVPNILTFIDTNLAPNTTYQYRVDAKKGNKWLQSNTVPLTTTGPGASAMVSPAKVAAVGVVFSPAVNGGSGSGTWPSYAEGYAV